MSRPQRKDPAYYSQRIDEIRDAATPVLERIEGGTGTTRDMAMLIEYYQQYADVLGEMADAPPMFDDMSSAAVAEMVMERIKG